MNIINVFGLALILLFFIGLFIILKKVMGWKKSTLIFIASIVITVYIYFSISLLYV
jgi:multisubunit Na+/H+ antiporter MnhC subunit